MIGLEDKKEIWLGLPQDTPEQQVWADNYYDTELVPMAQERFIGHHANEKKPSYYGMFLLLGTSWEQVAFNVKWLEPQNIHVLCGRNHDIQLSLLCHNLQLDEDSICVTTIQEGDAAALYRVIRKQHDIWDSMGRMAIDITGGSSLMRTAAAMAAAYLDIDVYRLESHYMPKYHRYEPGTEHMQRIPSVQSVLL